jgi:hypothetical protein
VLGISLGGALIDPRDDATFHPSLTVVCLTRCCSWCGGWLEGLRLERRRASFGDLLILLHGASAHPDGAHYLAVSHEGDAPGEYD